MITIQVWLFSSSPLHEKGCEWRYPPLKKGGRGELQQAAREWRTSKPLQSPFCKACPELAEVGGSEALGAQGWLDAGIWRGSFFDLSSYKK